MVGPETFQLFSRLGVKTIQTLSEMPVDILQQLVGKTELFYGKKPMGLMKLPLYPILRENPYPPKIHFHRILLMFKIFKVFCLEWWKNFAIS